jgi:cellulose biosynthesis protein BcsQ
MKVITCFSYKGGAGRTTAASNIAAALSSITKNVGSIEVPLRRKVALIDLDVFSAGTHRVFEISNEKIDQFVDERKPCVQDYLREQMGAARYFQEGGIGLGHPFMGDFLENRGGKDNCHPDFTLFPAKPDPTAKFIVQKQHENVLLELLMELETNRGFEYVILDGESGIRQMADIGLRLADLVLMFFRLTWQHIEGTLNTAADFESKKKPFYLIPTCVPLVGEFVKPGEEVYLSGAPGLDELDRLTRRIPQASTLNTYAHDHRERPDSFPGPGHFWDSPQGQGNRLCVHDSLCLKGEERVIVFDTTARKDRAAEDYYRIAVELDRLHPPSK